VRRSTVLPEHGRHALKLLEGDPLACRGAHFALTAKQASRLMDIPGADDDFLMAFVVEIEEGPNGEGWDEEWV
jgi:hypothetical protein